MTEQVAERQTRRSLRSPMRILDEFRELKDYSNDSENFRVLDYKSDNLMIWTGLIVPKAIPYNQKAYKVEIELPLEYPDKPPKITFVTKIFHPNISEEGEVKLELLTKKNWKSSIRMDEVIEALIDLIEHPNAENESLIANESCAILYKENNVEYLNRAENYAKKNALRRPNPLTIRKSKIKPETSKSLTPSTETEGTIKSEKSIQSVESPKQSDDNFVHEESLLQLTTSASPVNLAQKKDIKDTKSTKDIKDKDK